MSKDQRDKQLESTLEAQPDAEDGDLFRRAMTDAKPLQQPDRAPPPTRKIAARARFRRRDDAEVLVESLQDDIEDVEASAGENLRFQRPAVSRKVMRKLSRGNFSVQDEIDLHGMTVAEAAISLTEFLDAAIARRLTCVRIVHGKGLGSGARGPVLKNKVNNWLRRRQNVLAFVSARQVDGGTGAVYVLLSTRAGS